jgi:hypothetical protein
MEAGVFEHRDARIVDERAQVLLHRPKGQCRILVLRAAQVRAEPHLRGVTLEQKLDRRQRSPDPRVVRDMPVLERDVEVDAREHALARDVGVPNGAGPVHGYKRRCDRSTSRQL